MNDQDLRELLQTADAASPPPSVTAMLSSQVRARVRRRRTQRIAATFISISLSAIVASVMWHVNLRPIQPQVVGSSQPLDAATVRAHLAFLDQQALAGERAANLMLKNEAKSARMRTASPIAVNLELQVQLDQTARLLVDRADWLMNRPDARAQAVEEYRRVVELFPATPQAQTARERLDQMKL